MCIGTPMRVMRIAEFAAECSASGTTVSVDTTLLDGVLPGDYLLVHRGRGIRKLDPDEAAGIADALQAAANAREGAPFEHLLSDLIGRSPLLPEHLRALVKDGK